MVTFISTSKFELWWRKVQGWFAIQFASINFNPIEDKIDDVKASVAKQGDDQTATNTAIYNKLGNLVEADSEEYAAFKAHIEEAIEEVLTPIEEEENND